MIIWHLLCVSSFIINQLIIIFKHVRGQYDVHAYHIITHVRERVIQPSDPFQHLSGVSHLLNCVSDMVSSRLVYGKVQATKIQIYRKSFESLQLSTVPLKCLLCYGSKKHPFYGHRMNCIFIEKLPEIKNYENYVEFNMPKILFDIFILCNVIYTFCYE